jgi:hypothetical protein
MAHGQVKMLLGRGPGTIDVPLDELAPGCVPVRITATGETVYSAPLSDEKLAEVLTSAPELYRGPLPAGLRNIPADLARVWGPVFDWSARRWERVLRTSPNAWRLVPRYGAAGHVAAALVESFAGDTAADRLKRHTVGLIAILWAGGVPASCARQIVPGGIELEVVRGVYRVLNAAFPVDAGAETADALRPLFEAMTQPAPTPGPLARLGRLLRRLFSPVSA